MDKFWLILALIARAIRITVFLPWLVATYDRISLFGNGGANSSVKTPLLSLFYSQSWVLFTGRDLGFQGFIYAQKKEKEKAIGVPYPDKTWQSMGAACGAWAEPAAWQANLSRNLFSSGECHSGTWGPLNKTFSQANLNWFREQLVYICIPCQRPLQSILSHGGNEAILIFVPALKGLLNIPFN